jgi:hypothetical protein
LINIQVSYLDTGFSSNYFTDADQLIITPNNGSPSSSSVTNSNTSTTRTNRRYKTQLRDFLSTCRSKRKTPQVANVQQPITGTQHIASPPAGSVVDYISDPVAVAYTNLNPMYSTSPVPGYGTSTENLYMTHSSTFYPSPENLFHQYRIQSSYYHPSEYHHHHHASPYVSNGFLSYEGYGLASVNAKEEKWHEDKYYNSDALNHVASNGRNIYEPASHQPVKF